MPIFTEVWSGCCIAFHVNWTYARQNDIEDALELTFSTEDDRFGEVVTVDLKPDGRNIPVTNLNKKEYVEYSPPPGRGLTG